eukprot:5568813-Pleurochrysis_carterae.AAC.2
MEISEERSSSSMSIVAAGEMRLFGGSADATGRFLFLSVCDGMSAFARRVFYLRLSSANLRCHPLCASFQGMQTSRGCKLASTHATSAIVASCSHPFAPCQTLLAQDYCNS